jgi:hypothetical protein
MEDIRKNPTSKEERERLSKLWKIGKYREWEFDLKRMKELEKEVSDLHTHYGPKTMGKKPFGAGTGTGKKQLEAERQKLILEIENG